MVTLEEAKKKSNELQAAAGRLLAEHRVIELLSEYGEVKFGGSYKYGNMVKPDIDIGIYNPKITAEQVFELGKKLFMKFHRFYISDRTKLAVREDRPNGVYIGFIAEYEGLKWTFDIWAMEKTGERDPTATKGLEDSDWFEKRTQEEKDAMLLLKAQLWEQGVYIHKGVGSFHVYRAVIEGVRGVDDFMIWMENTYGYNRA